MKLHKGSLSNKIISSAPFHLTGGERTCWKCAHLNTLLNASIWDFRAEISQILSYMLRVWRQCTGEWIVCGGANDRDSGLLELITNCRHTHSLSAGCVSTHSSIFDQAPCRCRLASGGVTTKDASEWENFISICMPACFVCLISSCTTVPIVSHWGIVQSKQHLRTRDAAF